MMHPIYLKSWVKTFALLLALASQDSASWPFGAWRRVSETPIIAPQGDGWESAGTFNPSVILRDGKIVMLYRAQDKSGTSRLGYAESADGVHFTRRSEPVFSPEKDYEKEGGVEDPRLVQFGDTYYLTYTGYNKKDAQLCLATSKDLVHWERRGVILPAYKGYWNVRWTKSGAIVPEKIDGKYWMYFGEGSVYAATSTNLTDWDPVLNDRGEWKPLLQTRPGHFDSDLAESGPPAVITDKGIVFLYNGKNAGSNGDPMAHPGAYSGGQTLFDVHDPTKLIERTDHWFITPERPYETSGQYAAGTVFIEGLVHFKKKWFLYYGTADAFVAAAVAPE